MYKEELVIISELVSINTRDSRTRFGPESLMRAIETLDNYVQTINLIPDGYCEFDILNRLSFLLGSLKPENAITIFRVLGIKGKGSGIKKEAVNDLLICAPQVLAQINQWNWELERQQLDSLSDD